MPRRSSGAVRRERTPPSSGSTPLGGGERHQETAEGTFVVRSMSGSAAVKTYRCPGCDHEVLAGVAHVVVWPADGDGSDRRHWHSSCWQRRSTRGGPGRLPWTGL
ncbi:hypothetical protein JL107_08905 [Nakamurella flavida]|uniref:ATP/GTP-binding protein n=1 Tax=Nakamurella flavida TaxID=363630 RepID=A0A938YJZ6_9ACTN|nr:hypothetical protein [Nakamurella flavida]MBM9476559.1 hypothetical protein [Nakamurella flavida]MDP9779003.1 hypothetical protein [Nakamurella flavida]